MIDWTVSEKSPVTDQLHDDTHAGEVWRDVEMIQTQRALVEAQRKTAEQLHKIALIFDAILERRTT